MKLKLLAAIAAATLAPMSYAATHTNKTVAFDAPSRDVLAHPLAKLDEGRQADEAPNAAIHRNFSQMLEQNFAQLDEEKVQRLIDNLQDNELADMAVLYNAALADNHHKGRLLHVLAHRLDAPRLAKVARHFGYLPVYRAVQAEMPAKLVEFSSAVPLAAAEPEAAIGGTRVLPYTTPGQYWTWTPYEIYLDFRTKPVGALGVGGALFETAARVCDWPMYLAYQAGSKIGYTYVDPLIQKYDPQLWDAIGGTIDQMMQNWQNATQSATETLMQSTQSILGGGFDNRWPGGSTIGQVNDFRGDGGDYQIAEPWSDWWYIGGGNGNIDCGQPHCFRDGKGGAE